MKIQKVGLNLKITADRIKDISGSKVVPQDGTVPATSKNINALQPNPDVSQVNARTRINSPKMNLVNSIYSRQEIQGKKIDNLRKSNLRELSAPDKNRLVSSVPDVRQEKILEVRKRLAEGYYSRIEVYSKVADKILDILI
ncbi:MAG TPA: hypothetical protein VMT04_06645 [Terriglobales bacterium]|nr:hypothetical protein [Terriglobales bacterium]